MKKMLIASIISLSANPLLAEPFDIFDSPVFGIGSQPQPEPISTNTMDMDAPVELRTQSKAIELLGNEFARAAAQGLVDAHENPSIAVNQAPSGTLVGRSNLSVVTGLDRDVLASPGLSPTKTGAVCLSDRDVDVASWRDASDRNQLGKLRAQAIAEDGRMTSEGALQIARYNIGRGFGAEAKALIRYFAKGSDRQLVNALASIMDNGESENPVLENQLFCEGKISLWAALARPIPSNNLPKNTNSIMIAFSELPIHLRSHLGPLLAERLRSAGLHEQARQVLNAILRGGAASEDSTLETAKLGLSGTRPDAAREELIAISNGTDTVAAKALLALLSDAVNRNVVPPVEWVADVPSLVRATEGTQVSQELNVAGLKGLISLKKYDDLRLALNEQSPKLSSQTKASLARKALAEATVHASNEVFLRSVIGFGKYFEIGSYSRNDRFSLANRLSNLGLNNRSALFLPSTPETAEEKRIFSKVLSATKQTQTAIAVLEDSPKEFRTELGHLHTRAGNIDLAIESFEAGGQDESATLLAVQTSNWDWITRNGIDVISSAAQALVTPLPEDLVEPINGKLITQSQNRRQKANRLLEEIEGISNSYQFTN